MNETVFLIAIVFFLGTFGLYAICCRSSARDAALACLVLASVAFYGWWQPDQVPFLIGSIVVNYCVGVWIERQDRMSRKKVLLVVGVTVNLLALAHFKYQEFFLQMVLPDTRSVATDAARAIPLGISFLTFTQIAYLVDVCRVDVARVPFLSYAVAVTFFSKQFAGPIVRYKEVCGLASQPLQEVAPTLAGVASGLTLIVIGLGKKVVLGDSLAAYADPVFSAATQGAVGIGQAWTGMFAYTLQLYFDFSGYSDIAIGAAQVFGIRLPVNFDSPYKSTSIIDFWRRWHMTFSRFLRDYLYIPLGGNRKGRFRQYGNLFAVMVLGGLWHGANWTFIVWGALHGLYLGVNHAWRTANVRCPDVLAWGLTFGAVAYAWVWFRADTVTAGGRLTAALLGFGASGGDLHSWQVWVIEALGKPAVGYEVLASTLNELMEWPVLIGEIPLPSMLLSDLVHAGLLLGLALFIALRLPNSQELWTMCMNGREGARWPLCAVLVGALLYLVLSVSTSVETSTFVYFQF